MTNKEKHGAVLDELHEKRLRTMKPTYEFIWDGPCNWELYEASFPKIMFLVKESRNGFHPSVPGQKTNTRFMRNIARWAYLVDNALACAATPPPMPANADLPATNDNRAIVEVKKVNEERRFSSYHNLNNYAIEDAPWLRSQIDIIDPHVVFCANTLDFYDAIYNWNHLHDRKLIAI